MLICFYFYLYPMLKQILAAFILLSNTLFAQDVKYAHSIVDSLASTTMFGRGYVKNGDKMAALFIQNKLQESKLDFFGKGYFQAFTLSVNTFPGKVLLTVDGFNFNAVAGANFLLGSGNPKIKKKKCEVVWVDSTLLSSKENTLRFLGSNLKNKWIIVNKKDISSKENLSLVNAIQANFLNAFGVATIEPKKLGWHVSQQKHSFPTLDLLVSDSAYSKINKNNTSYITLSYDEKLIKEYKTQNVIGYIKGSQHPDSFIVFSAHYDHLGQMGNDAIFTGANDNASGTAMLLDLVKYYSKPENKPSYSIAFMFFGAEEAGLVGSKFYTENPLFPLKNIRFLINLDLMGAAEEGITVVNATEFTKEFETIKQLNDSKKYVTQIKSRGKAANSDHYFFSEKGVPAFFIYTMGSIKAYHDIYDTADKLPFVKYNELFGLITDFAKELQHK